MMSTDAACFHCGEANLEGGRYSVTILGEQRAMCCPGCQAVAETIVMGGLEDYYRQRFASAAKPNAEELEQVLAQADNLSSAELEQPWVHQKRDGVSAILQIDGVTCAACGWLIERHLHRQPGVVSARFNLSTHELLLHWQSDSYALADCVRELAALGYQARVRQPDDLQTRCRRERKAAIGRLAVGGLGAMQAMMYAVGLYFGVGDDMDPAIETFLRWTSLLVAIPVVTYAAWPFHASAWRSVRACFTSDDVSIDGKRGKKITNELTMDVPVSLAILITFAASAVATFTMGGEVYFESVAMFVFFISIGRFLEMLVRHRAAARNDRLGRYTPVSALRFNDAADDDGAPGETSDSVITRVPLSALQPGDRVLVKAGMTVPADGIVSAGHSHTDESFLTGESLPQEKTLGSRVLAGSINGSSPLTLRVEAAGVNTVFARIQHLQALAQSRKPRLARMADNLAGWFIGRLLLSAVAIGAIWLLVDPSRAIWVLVALLVASCPCALTLATSAAAAASGSTLAGRGFYLTGDNSLETLAHITDVVFDKTGTLTDGDWQLDRVIMLRDGVDQERALAVAASLERFSEHPLAQAFAHVETSLTAVDVVSETAKGLQGQVAGVSYKLGRADFAWSADVLATPAAGHSAILLSDDVGPVAWFLLQERLRDTAKTAAAQLKAQGIRLHLVSGDQPRAVERVAGILGIDAWRADCDPAAKLAYVKQLQADDRIVLMMGDGINDSPVMGAAHLSVALSSGADLTRQHADALLLGGNLNLLPLSMTHAQRTLAVIKQNLGWAVGYNVLILPLAALGWVTPWLAAIGMSASSLLVVLNAMRLNHFAGDEHADATPLISPEGVQAYEHHFSADSAEPGVAGSGHGSLLLGHETRSV